mmetsp:Transcript_41388/g.119079  ORF Transcript_41388/g.119079 Transcript_41388/m.119079 type:complete len:460 (-) Transcript_41388:411-1790(-)
MSCLERQIPDGLRDARPLLLLLRVERRLPTLLTPLHRRGPEVLTDAPQRADRGGQHEESVRFWAGQRNEVIDVPLHEALEAGAGQSLLEPFAPTEGHELGMHVGLHPLVVRFQQGIASFAIRFFRSCIVKVDDEPPGNLLLSKLEVLYDPFFLFLLGRLLHAERTHRQVRPRREVERVGPQALEERVEGLAAREVGRRGHQHLGHLHSWLPMRSNVLPWPSTILRRLSGEQPVHVDLRILSARRGCPGNLNRIASHVDNARLVVGIPRPVAVVPHRPSPGRRIWPVANSLPLLVGLDESRRCVVLVVVGHRPFSLDVWEGLPTDLVVCELHVRSVISVQDAVVAAGDHGPRILGVNEDRRRIPWLPQAQLPLDARLVAVPVPAVSRRPKVRVHRRESDSIPTRRGWLLLLHLLAVAVAVVVHRDRLRQLRLVPPLLDLHHVGVLNLQDQLVESRGRLSS